MPDRVPEPGGASLSGRTRASLEGFGVSRETLAQLADFAELVLKWTKRINLVSTVSQAEIWERHILDSVQLVPHLARHCESWMDIGSGGGFPAIPCAIVLKDLGASGRWNVVESDRRKAAFLQTAARDLSLPLDVTCARVESLSPRNVEVITARALTDLGRLFSLAKPHMAETSRLIAMKGARWESELAEARAEWHFDVDCQPSVTDPRARILICKDLTRVR